jgi:NAD(P)-dependent dehydrogenase (short-subunit alcohol dehydrogenase family)
MRLGGKTAIVTGAGSGIGRTIAERFIEEGARVLLVGRRLETLTETAEQLGGLSDGVKVQPADVSIGADCRAVADVALQAWGRIDILVNNAAVDHEVAFIEMSEEEWDEVLDINLKGPFLMSQAAARSMVGSGGGSIIHISSIDHFAANGLYSSYNVSKNGMMGLSRCMAVELAGANIRSNVVSPGATDTEMIARAAGTNLMGYMRTTFDRVPMRRLITTREIANACVFLASDDSSGMTGAEMVVDGGAIANMYMFETIPDFPAERAPAISAVSA